MEWVPIALIAAVLIVYGLIRILGQKPPKKDPVADAKAASEDIKTAANALLEEELAAIVTDKEELERITQIEDDEERLRALAEFGNRRRR